MLQKPLHTLSSTRSEYQIKTVQNYSSTDMLVQKLKLNHGLKKYLYLNLLCSYRKSGIIINWAFNDGAHSSVQFLTIIHERKTSLLAIFLHFSKRFLKYEFVLDFFFKYRNQIFWYKSRLQSTSSDVRGQHIEFLASVMSICLSHLTLLGQHRNFLLLHED